MEFHDYSQLENINSQPLHGLKLPKADLLEEHLRQQLDSYLSRSEPRAIETCRYDQNQHQPPIKVAGLSNIGTEVRRSLEHDYHTRGYALLETPVASIQLTALVAALDIGPIYVPPYLLDRGAMGLVDQSGINTIAVSRSEQKNHHAAFESNAAQAIHVDGTVAPIGSIATSILACFSPAATGGQTIIANTVAAFRHLALQDRDLAWPLLHPHALRRGVANDGGTAVGPAIAIHDDGLVSRFSVDYTSDWSEGFTTVPGLKRSFNAMMELLQESSPFESRFGLEAGQIIIMANSRISHGRSDFVNSPTQSRKLLRVLTSKCLGGS